MIDAAHERITAILNRGTAPALYHAIVAHELDTSFHLINVGTLAAKVAQALGFSEPEVERIAAAGLYHDIGKSLIPAEILRAPRHLTAEEWDLMYAHPTTGSRMLLEHGEPWLAEIVLAHHERLDGTGYPRQLVGVEIPIEAQIVAVVDCWDAIRYARSYQGGRPAHESYEEMRSMGGSKFPPELIELALEVIMKEQRAEQRLEALRAS